MVSRVWAVLLDRAGLPARTLAILCCDLISAASIGLTQPYLLVLLHTRYGLSITAATAVTSVSAVVSLVGNPLSGVLADRFGGRATVVGGQALFTAGLVVIGTGDAPVAAAVGIAVTGFGASLIIPALSALIAEGLSDAARSRAFTVQYGLYTAGLGVGALVGGLVVADPDRVATMRGLWFAAAAVNAAATGLLTLVRVRTRGDGAPPRDGYRRVLRDRRLLRLLVVAVGFSVAGYGVFFTGPSVVALTAGDPGALALVGAVNAAVIVVGMPLAVRLTSRFTPGTSLRCTGVLWGTAWLLCLAQAAGAGPGVRVILPVAAGLVGAGELTLASSLPTLVNALATDELRGRYNAVLTVALTLGVWGGNVLASLATAVGAPWSLFAAAVALLGLAVALVPGAARGAEPSIVAA